MKKTSLLLLIALAFASCEKKPLDQGQNNTPTPTTLDELNVPAGFDWSTSITNPLIVTLLHDPDISCEGQILFLTDDNDKILSKSIIKNDQAIFNLKFPTDIGVLYLFYPNTANKQKLDLSNNAKGGTNMTVKKIKFYQSSI